MSLAPLPYRPPSLLPVLEHRLLGLRRTWRGGVFTSFPHTSFSQNVGLIGVTGVKSRFVCATGGVP